ncbi:MAG TPA: hypothetical protein VH482_20915 [Thermomicrobiales bacterium]
MRGPGGWSMGPFRVRAGNPRPNGAEAPPAVSSPDDDTATPEARPREDLSDAGVASAARRAPTSEVVRFAAEWLVLAAWALLVAKPYLTFDPDVVPAGREYFAIIQADALWDRLRACGACALWNGAVSGGYPAFADVQGAMLHPLVVVPALVWGWINGAKVTVVAALLLAGLAQWWLARTLGLGTVARVWSGAVAVAAGNLTGRMEDGNVVLVVSGAACALVLPPFLQLGRDGRRRTAAALGLVLGLALLAGQGYLQIGCAFVAPVLLLILLRGNPLGAAALLRRYALALAIAVLVAAPLLVPFLHFWPSFAKDTDPTFGQAQPLAFVPLNLVVDDPAFYRTQVLGKLPIPYLYISYVGWLAVLLAVVGFAVLWRRGERRFAAALGAAVLVPLWLASAQPLRWLAGWTDGIGPAHEFLIGLRSVPAVAGLAVPPLLGLAAAGLDALWRWGRHSVWITTDRSGSAPALRLDPRWLLLLLLVLATDRVRTFSENWISTVRQPVAEIDPVLAALQTPDLQWVATPFGEQYWWGPAIARGLKLTTYVTTWHWKDRAAPEPVLAAGRTPPSQAMTPAGTYGGITVYAAPPGQEYAAVVHADGSRTVCAAHGTGGDIDVTCDAPQPGQVVVRENRVAGWSARVDGHDRPVAGAGGWLAVEVPAGHSVTTLRYRPWDVPLGVAFMLVGLAWAGVLIWRDRKPSPTARRSAGLPSSSGRSRSAAEQGAGALPPANSG